MSESLSVIVLVGLIAIILVCTAVILWTLIVRILDATVAPAWRERRLRRSIRRRTNRQNAARSVD